VVAIQRKKTREGKAEMTEIGRCQSNWWNQRSVHEVCESVYFVSFCVDCDVEIVKEMRSLRNRKVDWS
jgi:hypothetical protein